MEPILKVENLKTSFMTANGEVKAVRGVDFELYPGEIIGIVGESGSGKSVMSMSILRLLANNAVIKAGEITYKGKSIKDLGNREMRTIRGKEIAMIFQDPMSSLNPLMSIGKQIAEMIAVHNPQLSRQDIKEQVLDLLAKVKIPEPEKRYDQLPHEFSGGMRQRVMIAIALACNPSVLIADEPTTALDVTIQDQILKLLRSIQEEMGMSALFITHDLGVVAETCSRVIVMYGGMIMEEAEIDDLFENPAHPYTQGLLRSMPLINQDRSGELEPIPGSPPDMLGDFPGCPFAPRCSQARNICARMLPPETKIEAGHRVRCWLVTEQAQQAEQAEQAQQTEQAEQAKRIQGSQNEQNNNENDLNIPAIAQKTDNSGIIERGSND